MDRTTRLKQAERLDIITEFIKTGKTREGFKVKVNKNGGYTVRRDNSARDNFTREELEAKISELQRKLEEMTKAPPATDST